MRTQQEAERAEQQRIKALVLNYDLQRNEMDNGDNHGFSNGTSPTTRYTTPFIQPNLNRRQYTDNSTDMADLQGHHTGNERQTAVNTTSTTQYPTPAQSSSMSTSTPNVQRQNGAGGGTHGRRNQTARKLQLSDVDWYGNTRPDYVNDNISTLGEEDTLHHRNAQKNHHPSRRGRGRGRK